MSVVIRTYILYGAKVDTSNYDKNRFEDEQDFIDYIYDVINIDDCPYKVIYNEMDNSYYYGYIIDEASDSHWDTKYLSSRTFDEIISEVSTEVTESLDWMLHIHFNMRSETSDINFRILTVYC